MDPVVFAPEQVGQGFAAHRAAKRRRITSSLTAAIFVLLTASTGAGFVTSKFLFDSPWLYWIQQTFQIGDILRLVRFQFDLESPTLLFEHSSDLFEPFRRSYTNEHRIFLGAKFCRFLETGRSQPVLAIDNAFHLANIGNSVSHALTISNIVGLSHRSVSADRSLLVLDGCQA